MDGAARRRPHERGPNDGGRALRDVTRSISLAVQCILWGKAAGRCEFAGCNRPLWKSPVTQEPVNIAQKAHIYAFSAAGPRGNAARSDQEINELTNLMLVCHACHRKIDQRNDGGRYTAELLRGMKAQHEQRIERVTGIDCSRRSHVLLYGAKHRHAQLPAVIPGDGTAPVSGSLSR